MLTPNRRARTATHSAPRLWRVPAYSDAGFPRPTMRRFSNWLPFRCTDAKRPAAAPQARSGVVSGTLSLPSRRRCQKPAGSKLHAQRGERAERQAGHLYLVGLAGVVPTEHVQEAMDCQQQDFRLRVVAELCRLPPHRRPGDDDITQVTGLEIPGGEAQHVGDVVLAQELVVQPSQLPVARDADRELPFARRQPGRYLRNLRGGVHGCSDPWRGDGSAGGVDDLDQGFGSKFWPSEAR